MQIPMRRLLPLLICLFAGAGTAATGSIPFDGLAGIRTVFEDEGPQLEARLVISRDPTPRIGVLFDLAPGWHLYWRNPGETGIAPELRFEVTGHEVGALAWPSPQTFREADGLFTTYGYQGRVLLAAPIEAIDAATGTDITRITKIARVEATVLVCRTQCVPASFTLSRPLDAGLTEAKQSKVDALFRDAQARLPIPAAELGFEVDARWITASPEADETGRLELNLRSCGQAGTGCPSLALATGSEDPLFIPMDGDDFEFSAATALPAGSVASHFGIALQATRLKATADRLRGLVRVEDAKGQTRHVEIDLPIRSAVSPAGVAPGRWLQIFLLALLGGLILNAMPCVLPVLAIKVLAVAELAEKDPAEVRLHGLAYAAGVLASMALLSAVVLGLRNAGHSVGWGFQFQEPLFLAAISALLIAFALNLFGVYEIEFGQGRLANIGQHRSGLLKSAFEGLLAVVLATPCTAPFLGTAVGFAFATSGLGIITIFFAIGFGLASPFLVVSFVPRLARFIPRSGPWMIRLRTGLGFSLLATVVWLLWVLGRGSGMNAVIAMTGNLLFVAFLLWSFGQIQPVRRIWLTRGAAAAMLCLAFVGFNLIDFSRESSRPTSLDTMQSEAQTEAVWQSYSERAVADTLAGGRPAFVVFTADWCITCQINEHTVLDRRAVLEAFRGGGFVLFKADWTLRDEGIRKRLADFGRAGVPLYLVYSPDAPNRPRVLSELLSRREVIAALADIAGPRLAGPG